LKCFRAISLSLLCLLLAVQAVVFAQTTYTWQGTAGASWAVSTNWTPTRTTPATNDVLVFNGGGAESATAVPTQTIGQLIISGNTSVTLTSGTGTLTLSIGQGVAGTDLDVQSGSSLTLANGGTAFTVNYAGTSTTGSIAGQLTINTGVTWNTTTGTTPTTSVTSTVVNAGTVTGSAATLTFANGGTYQHNENGGTIPTATWNAASTLLVTGTAGTAPTGLSQSFGNVTWNAASQSVNVSFTPTSPIAGNLQITSTGSSTLTLGTTPLTISGNLGISGGQFILSSGTTAGTLTVSGNASVSGGQITMSSGSAIGTMNVAGNFSPTAGTITETSTGSGAIVFNGGKLQTYSSGGTISNTINFTVNASDTLQMAAAGTIVSGGGSFTLSAGATLGVTSTAGITTTGATGNIQVTGTRTYTAASNIIYNGASAQAAGNGLTSTNKANLTINNSAGVSLSAATTITGLLNMTSGTLDMANVNLTVGSLTGSGNITNSSGTAGARTLAIGSDNTSPAAYSGAISNGTATSVAVTKSGTGALTLSGNNTYSGVTTLSAGTLNINSSSAIGTGALTINGGTIDNTSAGTITLTTNNAITIGASFAYGGTNDLNLGTGAITNAGSRTITLNGSSRTLTFGGIMTNTAGAVQTTTVNGAGNTFVLGGYALSNNGTSRIDVINGTGNAKITGVVSNGGTSTASGVTYSGTGSLTLSGANTYAGGTTVSSGTLNINSTSAIGTGAFTISGGTIDNTSAGTITLTTNNAITIGANFAYGGTNDLNLGTGAITNAGSRTITLNGTGRTLTFGGTMTNTAGAVQTTTVNGVGNTFVLGAYALSNSATSFVDVITGTANVTITGVVSNGGTSTTSGLTFSGSGTLTLNGTNTYGGTTTISSGTVVAGNTQALGTTGGSTNLNGGILDLAVNSSIAAENVTVGGNATIVSDRATAGAGITHILGTLSIGNFQLSVTVGSNVTSGTAGLTFGNTSFSASAPVFDVASGANLTLGAIQTVNNFSKQGAGQITMNSAANAARTSGAFTLNAGTAVIGSASALGTTGSTLTVNGGTLDVAINSSINAYNTTVGGSATILSDRASAGAGITHTLGTLTIGADTLTIAQGANVTSGIAAVSFGNLTMNGAAALNPGTANLMMSGSAAGAFKLTKIGAGILQKITAGWSLANDYEVAAGTYDANGQTTTVAGLTTVSGGLYTAGSATQTFNGGLTIAGGTFTGSTGTVSATSVSLNSGMLNAPGSSGALNVSGDWTNNGGTFNPGSGTVTFNGNGAQGMNGTAMSQTFNNLTVNKSGGTLTVGGSTTMVTLNGAMTLSLGTFDAGTATTLNVAGNWTTNGGSFSTGVGTVNFNGSSASVIGGSASSTFYNLIAANSAGVSLGNAIAVNNNFSITLGTVSDSGYQITGNGIGTMSLAAGTGLVLGKTGLSTLFPTNFTSANTALNSTSTVTYNASLAQTVVAVNYGNLTVTNTSSVTLANSGTIGIAGVFTPGTASYTTTGSMVDFNGTGSQTIPSFNYNNLTVSAARTTNNVTFANGGTVGIAGTFTNTATFTSGGFITINNTVDYNGPSAQSVVAMGYNNLTFSNGGTKTFPAATVGIAGTFTISGLASADAISNNSTIDYNGSGAQSVLSINYTNLSFSNNGLKTIQAGVTGIAGDFTISGSATADATTNADTVDYNGAGNQAVAAINYSAMRFSNGGTKTLSAGTTRIATAFTISGTAGVDATTNSTTVEFNGTANQASPAVTYYDLVVNSTGTKVQLNGVTVNHNFTVTSGRGQVAGQNFTVLGTSSLTGELRITNKGGAKTLGDVVVNTGGKINFTADEDLTLNGNLQVDGTGSIVSGNGNWIFQKPGGGTISGTAATTAIFDASFTTNYANSGTYDFGNLVISGATLTNNGTLQADSSLSGTGTLTQGSSSTLNLNFVGAVSLSTLNTSASNNTVNYSAPGVQTVIATNYANLSFSGSGVKTLSSGTTGIAGTFSVSGATADATTNAAGVNYNGSDAQTVAAISYDDLTFSNGGTKTFLSGTTNIAGNLTLSGGASADATTNGSTIVYDGTSIQSTPALTYASVTVNNNNGITLSGNATINGTLTLTAGTISTGSNKVSISSTGSVSRTNGYVVGNLEKYIPTGSPTPTFEIGDATAYTPVALSFASVGGSGTFTARTTGSDHPQILTSIISPAKSANRYWTLTNNGVTFSTFDATFTFVPGDVDAGANTSAFLVDRYNAGTWTAPTVGTRTSTSTQATGITGDGDFQVGEQSTSILKTWDGGAHTNNWDDAANWNPDGVPGSNNNVSLTQGDTINIAGTDSAKSITFNNDTLLVTIQNGHSLVVVGDLLFAAGKLNTQSAFPSVSGTVSITGGTVGYTFAGAQTVAAEPYYHLTLSGSGIKTFASGTTQIAGNLTVTGATADATTNSTTVNYNGSGAQSVGPINYYNLSLSNAGIKTFGSGTVGIADTLSISGTASADATTNSTTVDYNGTGGQTVLAINYYHLNLSNSGIKTFASGSTGIAGNLTISGATADATTNATTINYNGPGTQTVGAINYTNLTLSNANPKTFSTGTTGIAGNLSITGSASADAVTNSTTVNYNGSGSQTIGATNYYNLTLSNAGTKTFAAGTTGIASSLSVTGSAVANATSNTTTINYNGSAAQSIAQFDYDNLTFSNAGIKQFVAGTTNIGGDLTVSGSATVDAATNATTIVFNGAGAQAVPAASYSTLTFATSGTKTLGSGTTTVSGVFSITGSAIADLTSNSTTFEYNASANQTAAPITYYNLISANTSTRLLVNNVTVNNNFTVQVGSAFVGGSNFSVAGSTTLNGEFRVTATGGAKTLGDVTINSSGLLNFTADEDLTINGSLTVNGSGGITSRNGNWIFQKTGGGAIGGTAASVAITHAVFSTAYSNSGSFDFGRMTVTGTTFTNNGTVTVDTSLSGNGTFTQGTNATLNYNSATDVGISVFTVNASGNTVNYGASASQNTEVADYYNLTFSGSGAKTFGSGTTRIAGTLALSGSATADATTNTPTVEFNGSSVQTIKGLTFTNVKINNAAGVSLNGNMSVNNTLTLTSGTITTGSDSVKIGSSGTVSRTSGHIVGNLVKTTGTGSPTITYEVGDGSGNYTPVSVAFAGVTVSGQLTVSTTSGDHPQVLSSGIEPSKTANRYWTLGGNGITYTSYSPTLNFVSGDLDGGANTAAFIVGRYQGGTWTLPTVGTRTSTSTQATGINGFGDFQVGEQATAVLKTWDGGASTNNWGDALNWSPDGVPTSSNNVNLSGVNTININVVANVNSITLNNASLVVTIQPTDSLKVAGDLIVANGTLNTQEAFPTVTGTVTLSGGTVGYTKSGAQSVAAESYYHLTLSGSGTKTFAAGTTVIDGDLNVSGASADATTDSTTIDFDGSAGQAVAAINYYNLTLSTAGTKTFASGTIGIANTFTISGTAAANDTSNATTVDYNGSGTQTVKAISYFNLSLSNAGTKTFASGTTLIAGSFALSGGATPDATTNSTTLNYGGSGAQTVGAINYSNLTLSNAGTKTFAAGTTMIAGNFTISGTATGDAAANSTTVNFNGSSAQNIAAANFFNLTLSGASTKILGAGTTGISGAFTLSGGAVVDAVANSTTIDFDGTAQNLPAIGYYNLTVSNTGTKTLAADTTVVNANLTVNGSATVDALTNSSTVEFTGNAIQTSSPATFYNLMIYKLSNRLTLDNLSVSHDFTILAGEGRVASGSFTVNGTTTISELFHVTSAAAVLNMGNIIVNNGAQLSFTANAPLAINGNLEVDGTGTVTSGTGLWTFQKSGGGGTISGTAASLSITNAAFTTSYANNATVSMGALTVTGATLTNNQTLTVSTSLGGTGSITQGASSTLTLSFNGTPTIAALNASASGNTVNYTSAGAQTVLATSYYDLNLGSSGTKTIASGTLGVADVLTISGATVDAISNANTFDFNGTGAQTVPAINFDNLTVSNSRTTNNVTMANGGTVGVAGAFNPTATFSSGGYVVTNNTLNFNGTVSQSVPVFPYYNLTISGSDTSVYKSASGTLSVSGALNVSSNGTLDMGSNSFATLGSSSLSATGKIRWAGSNIYIAGTGTTEFYGSSATTVAPGMNYGNMLFTGSGAMTISGAVTATGGTAATGVTVDNNLTIAPGGYLTVTGMDLNNNGAITNNGTITVQ